MKGSRSLTSGQILMSKGLDGVKYMATVCTILVWELAEEMWDQVQPVWVYWEATESESTTLLKSLWSHVNISHSSSYGPVSEHIPPLGHTYSQDTRKSLASREELVSVPVLGPEWAPTNAKWITLCTEHVNRWRRWKKTELHDLSRRGKSGIKAEKRKRAWLEWTRDQRGLCGVRWLTRKVIVGAAFLFCVA